MRTATVHEHADLWRLAHSCGVKPAFIGSGLASISPADRRRRASPDAVLAVLRSIGIPIDHASQACDAIRAVEQHRLRRTIEPIIVHWQGEPASATLRLTDRASARPIEFALDCEDGSTRRWVNQPDDRSTMMSCDVESVRYTVAMLPLPSDLDVGYHRLTATIDGEAHAARFFVAPPHALSMREDRGWGVFMPLYALRTQRDWGVGDLSDLQQLLRWIQQRGGSVVGTLPLLASYLDEPCDPSPYTPVSRMFFNELYLDVDELMRRSPDAAQRIASELLSTDAHRCELDELRSAPYVDYARVMAAKRRVLEPLARAAFADETSRRDIDHEVAGDQYLAEYARFRAAARRQGANWHDWPDDLYERIRSGSLRRDDADPNEIYYHLFVQHHLRRQLGSIAATDRAAGHGLYLDLPVGVHQRGYDAWRFADSFASGASCGAPPDELFIGGQNWGFAPLHPSRSRDEGHEWFIEAIRRHLRFAGLLRIDHVMWLHRMYWVPDGFPATDGVYVRNENPAELYAVLSIESHRHGGAVVGENLGTVPAVVNRTMQRRNIYPLAVGQFSLTADAQHPLREIPAGAVVSINTHDTPTFSGFLLGDDIDRYEHMGLLDEDAANEHRQVRRALREALRRAVGENADESRSMKPIADTSVILARLLESMGRSDAAVVLATLEDLWGEARPQNVPGTMHERNWSRRAAITIEEFFEHPVAIEILKRLNQARRMRTSTEGPS